MYILLSRNGPTYCPQIFLLFVSNFGLVVNKTNCSLQLLLLFHRKVSSNQCTCGHLAVKCSIGSRCLFRLISYWQYSRTSSETCPPTSPILLYGEAFSWKDSWINQVDWPITLLALSCPLIRSLWSFSGHWRV